MTNSHEQLYSLLEKRYVQMEYLNDSKTVHFAYHLAAVNWTLGAIYYSRICVCINFICILRNYIKLISWEVDLVVRYSTTDSTPSY